MTNTHIHIDLITHFLKYFAVIFPVPYIYHQNICHKLYKCKSSENNIVKTTLNNLKITSKHYSLPSEYVNVLNHLQNIVRLLLVSKTWLSVKLYTKCNTHLCQKLLENSNRRKLPQSHSIPAKYLQLTFYLMVSIWDKTKGPVTLLSCDVIMKITAGTVKHK